MVHHEHYSRVGADFRDALRIDVPDSHAVEGPRDPAPDPVADAEVEVGVERRDDLARVALDLAQRCGQGKVVFPRVLLGGGLHPAVGEQAVDERLALGALEGPDSDAQALAQLVDHLVRGMRHQEAQRGHHGVLVERPDGERRHHDEQPSRDRDAVAHRGLLRQ